MALRHFLIEGIVLREVILDSVRYRLGTNNFAVIKCVHTMADLEGSGGSGRSKVADITRVGQYAVSSADIGHTCILVAGFPTVE